MNDLNQGELRLAIATDQLSVAPGSSLEIPLVITNLGNTHDQVRLSMEGIPLVWVSTEQPVLLLQSGEERQIVLTINPPAPPNAHAGRYTLQLIVTSTIDPARSAQEKITLTVAGYEVKGRVGVLLDGLQFTVLPGDRLAIPVVLINQGLGADTFQLTVEDLPGAWVSISTPTLQLEPGEVQEAVISVQPPRDPGSNAGRRPFRILVTSQKAPEQGASIDCILTVGAFIQFKSDLSAPQPEQNLPAQVLVQNLSNVQATFQVAWSSPEESLIFDPPEPQQLNIPSGETTGLAYTAQPARRPFVGGEKSYPYTIAVRASDEQTQTLKGNLSARGMLPVWVAALGGLAIVLLCLWLFLPRLFPAVPQESATETPTLTIEAAEPIPTATPSTIDQTPLLIERNWFLVSFNETGSIPGVQGAEALVLFNPDGSLVGFTGCKDLNAAYATNFNQISITNLNLGAGACADTALQQQEDTMVAILRSARSYFVADTALQLAGDSGFMNFSLTPVNRPEEIAPPQAVIQVVSQAQVGQVVVFDGSASSGQVPLVSWQWDFGDGARASGVVVQHAYRDGGTFTVRLTVADQHRQTTTATQQIHILVPPTPTAQPTLPPPTATPEQPTFTPEAPPAQATDTPEAPSPPTATPEPPPVLEPPQASIQGSSQGFVGERVEFDASASLPGSSPIVSYSWSFGNGEGLPASSDSNASAIYTRTGAYEVSVTVMDANGLSSLAATQINIDARLDTDVWTLSAINQVPLLPGTAITLQFLQGELAGFAGCNTYEGSYTVSDNGDGTYSVVTGEISTGRLACPPDIMRQEDDYLTALQQTATASIQENMLILTNPAGELIFYLINPP